jgi:Family of unknown function (DUF6788)
VPARDKKRFLPDAGCELSITQIAESLYKIPTLLTTWTRCGKPNCRCNAGDLHGPYHALHWRDGTIQRRRYVRATDVAAVRSILKKRRRQRREERLVHAVSLRSWRALARLAEEYETHLREDKERP